MVGRAHVSRLLIVIGLMLAIGGVGVRSQPAHAQIDISGQWAISFTGDFSGSCEAAFFQTGADLEVVARCSIVGEGELTGTIDPDTGAVSLAGNLGGFAVELTATASTDGDTLTGTWNAGGLDGTFTGTRTSTTPGPLSTPLPTATSTGFGLPLTGGAGPSGGTPVVPIALLITAGALSLAAGLRLRRSRER